MTSSLLLAQLLPTDSRTISPAFWDFLLVGGVTLALALIIFVIAAVSHRGRRHRKRSRSGPEILKNTETFKREQEELASGEGADDPAPPQRRKRRRRDHRPRNPTLAQQGGLPPEREAGAAPKTGL